MTLSHDTVDASLPELDWSREGDVLVKVVQKADFVAALAYVNSVGELAEAANHHPDIDIRWNTITLRLTTHSAGGLTAKDLDLAAQIDTV
jgi:4a-hydroxytetrahydrobiopterin dehydratase